MPIYEHVPTGHEGPSNLLRSRPHPPRKAYVRFINTSNTPVTVKWVDFDGNLKTYRTLKENEYFDCDTFQDHAWVFREYPWHDPMHVANKEVFWPKSAFVMLEGNYIQKRSSVKIHRPLISLLTLAARAVRNRLRYIMEPFCLEIPFLLQTLLVRLMLKSWEVSPKRLNTQLSVPEDPENIILKSDLDDFQLNILFISYRLSLHARKLLSIARGMKGNGNVRATIIGLLETMICALGYEDQHNAPEMYSRKLAPVIWKQIIFLRVHLDNLQACCPLEDLDQDRSYYYYFLQRLVERRRRLMPPEHQNSLQKYHWEQLCLLAGDPESENIRIKDDPAYDIPELLPLSQRTEWEWIDLRRMQLRHHPKPEIVKMFISVTSQMLAITSRLENIFQVLGFFHYRLTGKQLTEETVSEEEEQHPSTTI